MGAPPSQAVTNSEDEDDEQMSRSAKRRKGTSVTSKSSRSSTTSRQKLRKSANLRSGASKYRSKRAGGDVQRKGMLQPYAFIPLDPRTHARKNAARTVGEYG